MSTVSMTRRISDDITFLSTRFVRGTILLVQRRPPFQAKAHLNRPRANTRLSRALRPYAAPLLEPVEGRIFLAAQMLADLRPGPGNFAPRDLIAIGDAIYF